MASSTSFATATNVPTGFKLQYTANQLDLVYSTTATTYTLSTSTSLANIRVNGSSTITETITNTGTGLADTLNYTGLTLSPSTALSGFVPQSGGPLAINGGTGSNSGTFTTATAGSYSFTPSVASATNATIGNTAAPGAAECNVGHGRRV